MIKVNKHNYPPVAVDLKTFNSILSKVDVSIAVIDDPDKLNKICNSRLNLTQIAIIYLTASKIDLIYKYKRYRLLQPFADDSEQFSGVEAIRILSQYVKLPKVKDYPQLHNLLGWKEQEAKYTLSASALIGFNPKFQRQELTNVYEYDLNSAYSSIIVNEGIPDIEHYRMYSKVKDNEIGFNLDSHLTLVHTGDYADVVMPLVKNEDLTRFCKHWYDIKRKNPKGSRERDKAKFVLNASIGYLQKTNPFIRAYIVNRCNEVILELMNKDVVLYNTDAIFSRVPRPELEIGEDIGQFKVEVIERLYYYQNNYQKNDDIPTYRGVCKFGFKQYEEHYGKKFLLKDFNGVADLEIFRRYEYDAKSRQIKERKIK